MKVKIIFILKFLFFYTTRLHIIDSVHKELVNHQNKIIEKEEIVLLDQRYNEYILFSYNTDDEQIFIEIRDMVKKILSGYKELNITSFPWTFSSIESQAKISNAIIFDRFINYTYNKKRLKEFECEICYDKFCGPCNLSSIEFDDIEALFQHAEKAITCWNKIMFLNNCFDSIADYDVLMQSVIPAISEPYPDTKFILICLKIPNYIQKSIWNKIFTKFDLLKEKNYFINNKLIRFTDRPFIDSINVSGEESTIGDVYKYKGEKLVPQILKHIYRRDSPKYATNNENVTYSIYTYLHRKYKWDKMEVEKNALVKTYKIDNCFESCKINMKNKAEFSNIILHLNKTLIKATSQDFSNRCKLTLFICNEEYDDFNVLFIMTIETCSDTLTDLTVDHTNIWKNAQNYNEINNYIKSCSKFFNATFYCNLSIKNPSENNLDFINAYSLQTAYDYKFLYNKKVFNAQHFIDALKKYITKMGWLEARYFFYNYNANLATYKFYYGRLKIFEHIQNLQFVMEITEDNRTIVNNDNDAFIHIMIPNNSYEQNFFIFFPIDRLQKQETERFLIKYEDWILIDVDHVFEQYKNEKMLLQHSSLKSIVLRIVSELNLRNDFLICTQLEEHKDIIYSLIVCSLFQDEDFKIIYKTKDILSKSSVAFLPTNNTLVRNLVQNSEFVQLISTLLNDSDIADFLRLIHDVLNKIYGNFKQLYESFKQSDTTQKIIYVNGEDYVINRKTNDFYLFLMCYQMMC